MERYLGRICPVCNNEILETDEVKVCSTCGVAHHQWCWDKNKGCSSLGCPEQGVPIAPMQTCVKCGAPMAEGQPFCGNCGYYVSTPVVRYCQRCNAKLDDSQSFCPNCGQRVGEAVVPPIQTAPMTPPPGYGYNPYQPVPPKKKSKAPFIIIPIAVVVIILVVIGLVETFGDSGGSSSVGRKSDFNDMFSEYADESWCTIASDGSYMKIDTNPYNIDDEMELTAYYTLEDINEKLGFSSAVYSKMGETSALDGRQTETHGRYTVSWKYHPDTGLEATYEIND